MLPLSCSQVDWEAILSQHPDAFIERLAQWFVPEPARAALGGRAPAASSSGGGSGGNDRSSEGGTGDGARDASGGGASGGGGGDSNGAAPTSDAPQRGSSAGSAGASPRGSSGGRVTPRDLPGASELPRAGEVLATMRRRVEALNGPDMPRLAF